MSDKKRWHVTHIGSEKSPMVWKLEGRQVILFGLSIGAAIFLFQMLVGGLGWGVLWAGVLSGLLPLGVLMILLTLVKGKPSGHFYRWISWQILRFRREDLLSERPDHVAEKFRRLRDAKVVRWLCHSGGSSGERDDACVNRQPPSSQS